MLFAPMGMLFIMKTLEEGCYIAMKACNGIIIYCMPALSLHIESTDSMRLYDKVMQTAEALYSVNCGKLN